MDAIKDIIEPIVDKVSQKILSTLQDVDPSILAVNFMAGHPLEIVNRLQARTNNDALKFNKYPLIALFLDAEEDRGNDIGVDAEVTLNLIIARSTKSDFIADQRLELNFKPILYPIYEEFLLQLYLSGKFLVKSKDAIKHQKIDRFFWGTESNKNNKANIFNDYIDCIEIKNLKLKVLKSNCNS